MVGFFNIYIVYLRNKRFIVDYMSSIKRLFALVLLVLTLVPGVRAGEFSVLTCSPGDEAYSLYGHTALRYRDSAKGTDIVFNYGCFDFSAPNFLWRFTLGETDYFVACIHYRDFLPEYARRGSAVIEQRIDLTPEQEMVLVKALAENCLPQNRLYRYRYLDNNCTTKVRDMLYAVLNGDVLYAPVESEGKSCRDALHEFVAPHPWFGFGIDLLLGREVDEPASREALQFLPLNFMEDLENASLVAADGTIKRIVSGTEYLLQENKPVARRNNLTPFNVSLLLLIATMVVMLCELRRRKTYWGLDVVLMLLQGVPGLLILFMWLFSEHPAVDNNMLIILLNPIALVLLPVMVHRIRKHRSMGIAWVQVVLVGLFFLSAVVGLQSYPAPIYFCALALMARALFHIYKEKICELNIV